MSKNEDKRPADWKRARQTVKNPIEAAYRSAEPPLVWLWDARPLETDSWGNILGFDDGQGGGDFIDMRLWLCTTSRLLVNEPPMYRPAHAPLPPFFKSGGVRRCYRPTDEDTAAVQTLYPTHRNPHAPPWQRIEADLIVAGHDRDRLMKLNPPALLRLLRKAHEQEGSADNERGTPPKRGRPGRKPDTDPKEDKRIFEAWQSGQYKTYAELENELRLLKGEGKRACDRHRKRVQKGK